MPDTSQTFDPRRFRTTVPFYARYRLGYPDLLIRRVTERVDLKLGDAVMDLGCGPGLLAVPFAAAGMMVTAVDPEPEMLAAAEETARGAGVTITAKQGSSFAMPQNIGPFKLVTMGRSFHWMDRAATLSVLDKMVTNDGAVALLHDTHPRTAENSWRRLLHDLGNKYGRGEEAHVQAREDASYHSHESCLLNSPFDQLERVAVIIKLERTVDDIVGLAFSLSTSAPQKLGIHKHEFEAELRAGLATLSPDGCFSEIAEMSAVIARRSQ